MNLVYLFVSLAIFIAALGTYRKAYFSRLGMSAFFVTALCSILLYAAYGVATYFTGDGINEVIVYYVKYGLGGSGLWEYSWLVSGTIAMISTGAFVLFWFLFRNRLNGGSRPRTVALAYSLLVISIPLSPACVDVYRLLLEVVSSSPDYQVAAKQDYTDFHRYYREPYIVPKTDRPKNLVIIYAEQLERTYFDQTLFPELIKELRELESRSTYFTNIRQTVGTGWTMGGLTACQCGIPLFCPCHGNSMSGMDQFLPSAVCLGDLLRDKGYHLVYLGGASLDFGGKGKFFATHGFSEVKGRDDLLPKLRDPKYHTDWGLYDDTLFNIAYRRFQELSAARKPFGLFMLTLDTHHPNGHPSKTCRDTIYGDASNPILNAVACSDHLIADFISKIIKSPYAEQTVIALVSDHLAMRNSAYGILKGKDRKNLFMIIEPTVTHPNEVQTAGSILDIGPTLLPFLGYDGDIGLGRDLLDRREQTDTDREQIQKSLNRWRVPISNFWNFPKIHQMLEIDVASRIVRIDGRPFKAPILIELNSEMQTTLKFQFNSERKRDLVKRVQGMKRGTFFLLVDECPNARAVDRSLGKEGLCLLAGRGKKFTKISKIKGNVRYTANELRAIVGITTGFCVHRVAHAGGAINGETYTNSYEALNSSVKKGFVYFEIDLSFTKDAKIVCLHDWKDSVRRSFGLDVGDKLTLSEFRSLVKTRSRYTKCTLDGLAEWMIENPSAFIVTDVKDAPLQVFKALKILMDTLPDAQRRVIPQIYDPTNFRKVKALGFEQIIWTLYRYPGTNEEVLKWIETFCGPIAVTMPRNRAESSLPTELAKMGIPTYVHTINRAVELEKFVKVFGVTEIYTDTLDPHTN